jgi:hypothetical protein
VVHRKTFFVATGAVVAAITSSLWACSTSNNNPNVIEVDGGNGPGTATPQPSGHPGDTYKDVNVKDQSVPEGGVTKDASAKDATGTSDGAVCNQVGSTCTTGASCCNKAALCAAVGGLTNNECCLPNQTTCASDDDCCGGYLCTNGTCTASTACADIQAPCNKPADCCAPGLSCASVGSLIQSWCCIPPNSPWPCHADNDCCGQFACDQTSKTCK